MLAGGTMFEGCSTGCFLRAVLWLTEQIAEAREQLEQGKPVLATLHRTFRLRQTSHARGSRFLSMVYAD